MKSLLGSALRAREDGSWNCDDVSVVEHLLHLHSGDMYQCIGTFCRYMLPRAQITSERGPNLRLRFDPEGSLGMSITSWKEIHLVRYEHEATGPRGRQDSNLCNDRALGYSDIQRFGSFKEVCEEIRRVEMLLRQRRQKVAENKQLAQLVSLIRQAPEFSAAHSDLWLCNDSGLCFELAPGKGACPPPPFNPLFCAHSLCVGVSGRRNAS